MNITATLKNINKITGIGTIYIYVDIYAKSYRNRIFYQTSHKVEANKFLNGRLIGRTEFVKTMNNRIQSEIETIKDVILQLEYEGKEINKSTLIEARNAKNEGVKDLITLAKDYIQLRNDAKPRMIEKLNNLVTRLEEFKGNNSLYYSDLNQKFINDFAKYLQSEKSKYGSQQPSTIQKTFAFFRQILNHYNNSGIIDDKYKKLKYPQGFDQKQMIFIESEIKLLINYEPKSARLEKVKDLALLQLFTGLRFSDAIKLNESNVFNNALNIQTQKTNQIISIPVHAALSELLKKYNYDLRSLKISNVNYNLYLKELIKSVGITSKSEFTHFVNGEMI